MPERETRQSAVFGPDVPPLATSRSRRAIGLLSSVAVHAAMPAAGAEAFRWTSAGGLVGRYLGIFPHLVDDAA